MNREEILQFLAKRKQYFADQFNIVKIGLFGSLARNEKSNDVDIMIEFGANTEGLFDKKFELKQLLEKEFGLPVDICREKSIRPSARRVIDSDLIFV